MTLSKESADAFRQCLRILAPRCTPEEKRVQSRNVESYIAEGKWIPALQIEDIALLFYPNDSSLESAMLIKMKAAIETQELISTPRKKDVLMASDLAAWPDCPPVPLDSSLRYWLPDWMHATPAPVESASTTPSPAPTAKTKAKRRTWWDVSSAYIIEVMRTGQYASGKELYNALGAKAGPDSPFEKGTGDNRGSLFVREIAESLSMKTVQNKWQTLRELAQK